MTNIPSISRLSLGLLASVSALAVAAPASAGKILFSEDPALAVTETSNGQEVRTSGGTTQIMTDSGAIVSLVGAASVKVEGNAVSILSGNVTVAAPRGAIDTTILLPGGATARLAGSNPSGSFTVQGNSFTGHTLGGSVAITSGGQRQVYSVGSAWQAEAGRGADRVFANRADAVPAAPASAAADAEPAGDTAKAAAAGIPVNLGEALAAVGASGDVVQAARNVEAAAANPAVPAFPAGDVATLVGFAAQLQEAYGARAFEGAEPGIIQAYLGFLADGGAADQFKATYAALINQYIDLIRSGASPSSFEGANQQAVNAYLNYLSTTGALQGLSEQNAALASAYLNFLSTGGGADGFVDSYTNLVNAYIDFIGAGGAPAQFTGASQEVINAYFTFLQSSGLVDLIGQSNRAIFDAYAQFLANGGTGVFVPPTTGGNGGDNGGGTGGNDGGTGGGTFVLPEYASILQAYIEFLRGGGNPNAYAGISADLIRQYLNQAIDNGLFAGVPQATIQQIRNAVDLLAQTGTLDAVASILAGLTLTLPTAPTTPGVPTGPTTPTTPVNGNERSGQMVAYAGDVIGIDARDESRTTLGPNGQLLKYVWTVNPDGESPEIGTNDPRETGSVAGVIGWTRWAGGTTAGSYFGNPPVSGTDRQGRHFVHGTPASVLPPRGCVS